MRTRTHQEILDCLKILEKEELSHHDREMAERGLNDWFLASLFEEGLITKEEILNEPTNLPRRSGYIKSDRVPGQALQEG